MNILISGVTETHTNHPQRASSTKFVSIPELMASAFGRMGHHVDHRAVTSGEDLSRYDKVFVYLYPLDHNALDPDGALWALESRFDAYVCLDDWAFQKILPSWENKIAPESLCEHTWIAPLFPWGDTRAMGLPVENIIAWDPSPLYEMPAVHQMSWDRRKTEWYNASLSKEAHDWATAQNLSWPIHSVGVSRLANLESLSPTSSGSTAVIRVSFVLRIDTQALVGGVSDTCTLLMQDAFSVEIPKSSESLTHHTLTHSVN